MTTAAGRRGLERLLEPRHVAFVGGHGAAAAAAYCREAGFAGPVWLVSPTVEAADGLACFKRLADLPEAPDAVFVGTRAEVAVEVVAELAALGAGGAVCHASGFAETGAAGRALQDALVAAAGDMALLGPNCLGFVGAASRLVLWPIPLAPPAVAKGVAVITQSGNFALSLAMADRSLPISHLLTIGNQAQIGFAELIDTLTGNPAVTAIGLHIEGLADVAAFSRAAARALEAGVPIVAFKVGRSDAGARVAVSHTSSLAAADAMFDALFARLGIARAHGPAAFVEAMKLLAAGIAPAGDSLAVMACSGGDAAMAADFAVEAGLSLPQPTAAEAAAISALLPSYGYASNPLDFTLTFWGDRPALERCFRALIAPRHDAALLVLDYPRDGGPDGTAAFDAAAAALAGAIEGRGIPGLVASVFPESMPAEARQRFAAMGLVPLQGLEQALAALAGAAAIVHRRRETAATGFDGLAVCVAPPPAGEARTLDEWESRRRLEPFGLAFPAAELVTPGEATAAARRLGFPVAVKLVDADLAHKTEAGAVTLGLSSADGVAEAVARMRSAVGIATGRVMVTRMIEAPVAELLIGVTREVSFGLVLTLAAGGVLVELLADSATLLLPTDGDAVRRALSGLRVGRLLAGYRGRPAGDIEAAVAAVLAVARFAEAQSGALVELDVNPLMVLPAGRGAFAADALVRLADGGEACPGG